MTTPVRDTLHDCHPERSEGSFTWRVVYKKIPHTAFGRFGDDRKKTMVGMTTKNAGSG